MELLEKSVLVYTFSLVSEVWGLLEVAYIDTEGDYILQYHPDRFIHSLLGTFRPDRIRSIADRFGVDGNMVLENILCGIHCPILCDFSNLTCLQRGRSTASIRYQTNLIIILKSFNSSLDGTYQWMLSKVCRRQGFPSTCDSQIRLFPLKLYQANGWFTFQIVDSIMALFRVDFSGRGELSERQQKVSSFSSTLHQAQILNLP